MDRSGSKLLLGLTASILGTAVIGFIVYKHFFPRKRSKREETAALQKEEEVEPQVSPPTEFKNSYVACVAPDTAGKQVHTQVEQHRSHVVANLSSSEVEERILPPKEQPQINEEPLVPEPEGPIHAQEEQHLSQLVKDVPAQAAGKPHFIQAERHQFQIVQDIPAPTLKEPNPTPEEQHFSQAYEKPSHLKDEESQTQVAKNQAVPSPDEPIHTQVQQNQSQVYEDQLVPALEKSKEHLSSQTVNGIPKQAVEKSNHTEERQNQSQIVEDTLLSAPEVLFHTQEVQSGSQVVKDMSTLTGEKSVRALEDQHSSEIVEDLVVPAKADSVVFAAGKPYSSRRKMPLDEGAVQNSAVSNPPAVEETEDVTLEISPPGEFKTNSIVGIVDLEPVAIGADVDGQTTDHQPVAIEELIVPAATVDVSSVIQHANSEDLLVPSSDSDTDNNIAVSCVKDPTVDINLDAMKQHAEDQLEDSENLISNSESKLENGEGSMLLNNSNDDSLNAGTSIADSGIELPNVNDSEKLPIETPSVASVASVACSDAEVSYQETGSNVPAEGAAMDAARSEQVESTSVDRKVKQPPSLTSSSPKLISASTSAELPSQAEFKHSKKIVHTFLMHEQLCGRFIGKGGRNISALKHQTKTNIKVGHEAVDTQFKICTVEGYTEDVERALKIIQKRYPDVDVNNSASQSPTLTLSANRMQLHLPIGVMLDVVISKIVSAGHVFVQQPTQPVFTSWQSMNAVMNECYGDGSGAPTLPEGVEDGILCVAPVNGRWHRAQIMELSENRVSSEVKLMDEGGYETVNTDQLRQIREDFLYLPFQAVECYLSNIMPLEGNDYSQDANEMLRILTSNQVVKCQAVAMSEENNIPYVHIVSQRHQKPLVVNRELADQGLVSWYDMS